MTPLAHKVARELTLPKAQRTFGDTANLLSLIGQEMHCFEVSSIVKSVTNVMEEENVWPEIASMLPEVFLPSPVTWLEFGFEKGRLAYVITEDDGLFSISLAIGYKDGTAFSMPFAAYRPCSVLESPDRIFVKEHKEPEKHAWEAGYDSGVKSALVDLKKIPLKNKDLMTFDEMDSYRTNLRLQRLLLEAESSKCNAQGNLLEAKLDMIGAAKHAIAASTMFLNMINTPGLLGLKQRDSHRALGKQLAQIGVGGYPLRAWSEVVVKTHTRLAGPGEKLTGASYHKCLHFVRSHARHYIDGKVSIIPAHWRGDPALGIKRTRYRVDAA